jgi:hypothetical protein
MTARGAWLAILAGVAGYEFVCPDEELLTRGLHRCLQRHPVTPRLVVVLVALHLCKWLPRWADPIGWMSYGWRIPRPPVAVAVNRVRGQG